MFTLLFCGIITTTITLTTVTLFTQNFHFPLCGCRKWGEETFRHQVALAQSEHGTATGSFLLSGYSFTSQEEEVRVNDCSIDMRLIFLKVYIKLTAIQCICEHLWDSLTTYTKISEVNLYFMTHLEFSSGFHDPYSPWVPLSPPLYESKIMLEIQTGLKIPFSQTRLCVTPEMEIWVAHHEVKHCLIDWLDSQCNKVKQR